NNIELDFYQYFDINLYRIQLQWIRTGTIAASLGDEERFNLNKHYNSTVQLINETLVFHQYPNSHTPIIENITNYDPLPFDVFFTDLSLNSEMSNFSSYFYQKKIFFGEGGARKPDYLYKNNSNSNETNYDNMPYCLILSRHLTLAPGQTIYLRYAFGVVIADDSRNFVYKYRKSNYTNNIISALQAESVYFHIDPSDQLNITNEMSYVFQREMNWHSTVLIQSTIYNEYFNVHLIPQGSAYLYLHGLDGAPRDLVLTSIVVNYLKPKLSKDILILIMSQQNSTTGQLPYSFAGNGMIADALGLHAKPSDLDIYFLWGLAEYISATGDTKFLFDTVQFYCSHQLNASNNTCNNGTVLEHAKLSYYHLITFIGIGESGLLKISDGDWDDGIVVSTCISPFGIKNLLSYKLTEEYGESIPNTEQALYVLPLISSIVKIVDEKFASQLLSHINSLKQALKKQFNGYYFNRAIFKNIFNKSVILLIETIYQQLDDITPNGAALQAGGQVWSSISQLLTWSYVNCNYTKLAWRSLFKNTFANYAKLFPSIWYNIWSGPDGILSTDGSTWSSPVTPMTDFPVMNSNPHVMPLFATLKMAAQIQPSFNGNGLSIDLTHCKTNFNLNFPLIQLNLNLSMGLKGIYRAANDGKLNLYIIKPNFQSIVISLAFVNGQELSFETLF
ncbi:unnamed protein product, partial [Rotaria sp. Silwood2]